MSDLLASRIESTIAAGHDLLQELCTSRHYMHLDALYVHVLSTCSDDNGELAGKLLGTAALLDAHPTPSLLVTLLQLPLQEVMMTLQDFVDARVLITDTTMNSITDETSLHVCHNSLRGFVVDPLRCRLKHYLMSPPHIHEALLYRCLSLLNAHLRQDICDIHHPGISNADVPGLPSRITQCIPEAVRYACLSWPVHLLGSGSPSGTVSAALIRFCTDHLLHWIEVLSLLGKLGFVNKHLPKVMAWCQVSRSFGI
jgi:hypothetical protein